MPFRALPQSLMCAAVWLSFTACSEGTTEPNPVPTSIQITPDTVIVDTVDPSITLVAVVFDQNGNAMTSAEVSWASTNGRVASVVEGEVTVRGVGESTIRASAGGATGEAHIRVVPIVSEVTVVPSSAGIGGLPADVVFSAIVRDQFGATMPSQPVTWTSSDPSVATIDGSGSITPVGLGEATIEANADGVVGEGLLTIYPYVSDVVVTPDSVLFGALGDTVTLMATAFDQFGEPTPSATVRWDPIGVDVAAVDQHGRVTAIGPGRESIQAQVSLANGSGRTGYAEIAVVPARAYLSHRSSGAAGSLLMKVDPVRRAAVDTATVPALAGEIAFGPNEQTLYVASNPVQPGSVAIVDREVFDMASATVEVGRTPIYVASQRDGSEVYVANVGGQEVAVLDTDTDLVTARIDVAGIPRGLAVTPDGSEIWVPLGDDCPGRIDVIDVAARSVIESIFPGECTGGDIAFTPDGNRAYVPDGRFGTVTVLDVPGRSVIQRMTGFQAPIDAVVSPDGRSVYVTNFTSDGSVGVITTATLPNRLVTTIELGPGRSPRSIAASPEGLFVAATIPSSGEIVLIDAIWDRVLDFIPVGQDPFDILFTR